MFAVYNDAGLLREYISERYGDFFTYGGALGTHERAMKAAHRLAKLTGYPVSKIIETARADYALLVSRR